jgi:isocitrate/isopropylmalate dehydrogenase
MTRVAVIPGDDAAPEAVHAALSVLRDMALPVEWIVLPDGTELAKLERAERERMICEAVDSCDTTLFGATSGVTGGIGYLRWGKRSFANVRPIKWRRGVPSPLREPDGIDYVIVRENLEDVYSGMEGSLDELRAAGLPVRASGEGRYAVKVITRENTEAVARFAFELANARRSRLTCAVKWNVLPRSDGFFLEVVREVAASYPQVALEEFLADDFARRLVASPHQLDVVLLPNLYGDILSDEGAGCVGGLGMCPSGCYGSSYAYFEPVHGTAPDIAGKGVINPVATLLSAAMLLEHVGLGEDARRLESAVDSALAARDRLTPDIGGASTTVELASAIRERL